MSDTTGSSIADRYGAPRGQRRGLVAGVVVLAAAFGAWVMWAALGAAAPTATGDVIGFTVGGPSAISVRVALSGVRGPVACTVQAQDVAHAVVGQTTARGTVGSSLRRTVTVVVRTRSKAVSATVTGCSARSK